MRLIKPAFAAAALINNGLVNAKDKACSMKDVLDNFHSASSEDFMAFEAKHNCEIDSCPKNGVTSTKNKKNLKVKTLMKDNNFEVYNFPISGLQSSMKKLFSKDKNLKNDFKKYGWTVVVNLKNAIQGYISCPNANVATDNSGTILSISSKYGNRDMTSSKLGKKYGIVISVDRNDESMQEALTYAAQKYKSKPLEITRATIHLGEFNDISCLSMDGLDIDRQGFGLEHNGMTVNLFNKDEIYHTFQKEGNLYTQEEVYKRAAFGAGRNDYSNLMANILQEVEKEYQNKWETGYSSGYHKGWGECKDSDEYHDNDSDSHDSESWSSHGSSKDDPTYEKCVSKIAEFMEKHNITGDQAYMELDDECQSLLSNYHNRCKFHYCSKGGSASDYIFPDHDICWESLYDYIKTEPNGESDKWFCEDLATLAASFNEGTEKEWKGHCDARFVELITEGKSEEEAYKEASRLCHSIWAMAEKDEDSYSTDSTGSSESEDKDSYSTDSSGSSESMPSLDVTYEQCGIEIANMMEEQKSSGAEVFGKISAGLARYFYTKKITLAITRTHFPKIT